MRRSRHDLQRGQEAVRKLTDGRRATGCGRQALRRQLAVRGVQLLLAEPRLHVQARVPASRARPRHTAV